MEESSIWRKCSACKKPIPLGAAYQVCSVSTCNRKRTGLVFCSVECWEVHLPTANHREAWALEKRAPRVREEDGPASVPGPHGAPRPKTRRVARPSDASKSAPAPGPTSAPVLIVASRLKAYIRETSGFNTSERVLDPLSEHIRRICDRAVENASREGRKTVLDRDIPDIDIR